MITRNSAKLVEFKPGGSTTVEPRRFHFTKKALEQLKPGDKKIYWHDNQVSGLTVAVTPNGTKTFFLYRKVAGRPERIKLGRFPAMTVDQARGRAQGENSRIEKGENPAQDRRAIRNEHTLGELWAKYFAEYAQYKRTAPKIEGMFNLYLKEWQSRKLSSITHSDVVRLHDQIGRTRGKIVANRAVELLCSMFNQARERWSWAGDNPAADVQAFPEKKRERFIQPDELPRFFQALNDEPNTTIRDYIFISLVTGARRANVQAMQWAEINFDRATWKIPRTKNEDEVTIALTDAALRVLHARKAEATGAWVFPGDSASGHLQEPKTCWKRILKRAGIGDLRLHDLRRTFGAYQACNGSSLPIIGASLGHRSVSATQIYARLNLDPVRASVSKAVDKMLLAGGVAGLLSSGLKR